MSSSVMMRPTSRICPAGLEQVFGFERRVAREQFVEQYAERIDVAAGVDVLTAQLCLSGLM